MSTPTLNYVTGAVFSAPECTNGTVSFGERAAEQFRSSTSVLVTLGVDGGNFDAVQVDDLSRVDHDLERAIIALQAVREGLAGMHAPALRT